MSNYFTEENSAELVIERFHNCKNPRLKEVMIAAVRHLHEFAKEVEPTMDEWCSCIQFLTDTGKMCDEKRQEWILASDTLGVSMLLETINHRSGDGRTEATVIGPFFREGAPHLEMGSNISQSDSGERCLISGVVQSIDGSPIKDAMLDVWQTNGDGYYDVQSPETSDQMDMRAKFITGGDGKFWFKTVKPVSYPVPVDGPAGQLMTSLGRHAYRPAHIHFMVHAIGYENITTHLFVEGDPYIESDAVFGVKESLIIPFTKTKDNGEISEWSATFDFSLAPI